MIYPRYCSAGVGTISGIVTLTADISVLTESTHAVFYSANVSVKFD